MGSNSRKIKSGVFIMEKDKITPKKFIKEYIKFKEIWDNEN